MRLSRLQRKRRRRWGHKRLDPIRRHEPSMYRRKPLGLESWKRKGRMEG